jgi:hypothetical protein
VTKSDLEEMSAGVGGLEELAIVRMFAGFEAAIRQSLETEVRRAATGIG